MPPTGLKDWSNIKASFDDCLLLGNGASIAIHRSFNYRKLLTEARARKLITSRVRTAFEHFDTVDFEYVLSMLWHAQKLNEALGVKEAKTRTAYRKVREALVKVITHVHADYPEALPKLKPFYAFLQGFDTILSLNYDLTLYWARMLANEDDRSISFKDCFVSGKFDSDWRRFREPISPAKRSILVFYPHGNIAIASDVAGNETKVHVSNAPNLLDQIQAKWETEDYVPVFVSEGRSEQKLSAIYRSNYLATVFDDVLPNVGVSLAVYGCSFGDGDDHIIRGLSRGRIQRIAVSIYTPDPQWRMTRDTIRKKMMKYFPLRRRPELIFFDSASVEFANPIEKY